MYWGTKTVTSYTTLSYLCLTIFGNIWWKKSPTKVDLIFHLGKWWAAGREHDIAVNLWKGLMQMPSGKKDFHLQSSTPKYKNDEYTTSLLGELGVALRGKGCSDDAIQIYTATMERMPHNITNIYVFERLVELHRQMGQYENCVELYEKAIKKRPFRFRPWLRLCELHFTNCHSFRAVRACEQGIQDYPRNPSPLMVLSNIYATRGDY